MITTRMKAVAAVSAAVALGAAGVAVAAQGQPGPRSGAGQGTGTCTGTGPGAQAGSGGTAVTPGTGAQVRRMAGRGAKGQGRQARKGQAGAMRRGAAGGIASLPLTTLTADETASLVAMRQEEKLARDVYQELSGALPVLPRVAASEQRHMDAVLAVLKRHGVADPVAGMARGQYADPALETLYVELVAQGKTDPAAVGIRIEKLDLADLGKALGAAKAPDVVRVYTSLKTATQRHLAAFTAAS